MARVTEAEIAEAVRRIAASRPDGVCTLERAFAEVPGLVRLSPADWATSAKRPAEPMWHQLVRNIWCHRRHRGNYIKDGVLRHIPRKGYRIPALEALSRTS